MPLQDKTPPSGNGFPGRKVRWRKVLQLGSYPRHDRLLSRKGKLWTKGTKVLQRDLNGTRDSWVGAASSKYQPPLAQFSAAYPASGSALRSYIQPFECRVPL